MKCHFLTDYIPGEGNSNPLQYSCLGNPMNRGACWAIVRGVTMNRTQLSDYTITVNANGLDFKNEKFCKIGSI